MTINDRTFSAWASDVTGESSDRPVSPYIEQRIRAMFNAMDHEKWDELAAHFGPDAKMIIGVGGPETVWHTRNSIVGRFKESSSGFLVRTVPRLIFVDRGRVTSYNTEFEAYLVDENDAEIEVCQFTEVAEVAVMDLDEKYRVKRIEYFKTDEAKLTHDGSLFKFYDKVEKAKNEAAKIVLPK